MRRFSAFFLAGALLLSSVSAPAQFVERAALPAMPLASAASNGAFLSALTLQTRTFSASPAPLPQAFLATLAPAPAAAAAPEAFAARAALVSALAAPKTALPALAESIRATGTKKAVKAADALEALDRNIKEAPVAERRDLAAEAAKLSARFDGSSSAPESAAVPASGANVLRPAEMKRAVSRLLRRPTSPSVEEFLQAFPSLPGQNPFRKSETSLETDALIRKAPKVIATLEAAFPGATWAVVGRDARVLGTILEAYYLSRGEKGRVVRLDTSDPSVPDMYESERVRGNVVSYGQYIVPKAQRLIYGFLRTNGLKLNDVKNAKPYILLDSTAYMFDPGSGAATASQTRNMMMAAYHAYSRRGGDPKDLIRKLNVVNLDLTQRRYADEKVGQKRFPKKGFSLEAFLQKQEATATRMGPSNILKIKADEFFYGGGQWHGKFGPMRRMKGGRVVTRPTTFDEPPDLLGHRAEILRQQYEIVRSVFRPEFAAAVELEKRSPDLIDPAARP
jgi:hypothetical protein